MADLGTDCRWCEGLTGNATRPLALALRWGGLGDLCLTLPSLLLVLESGYRMRLLGNGAYLGLLQGISGLEVADLGSARFAPLFSDDIQHEDLPCPETPHLILCFRRQPEQPPLPGLRRLFPKQVCWIRTPAIFERCPPQTPCEPVWQALLRQTATALNTTMPAGKKWALPIREQARNKATDERSRLGVDHYICLFPGSGAPAKTWPRERWLDLARKLEQGNLRPLFCIAPSDPLQVPFPTLRTPDLELLAAVISGAHAAVGGDSGLSHLAALCGCPLLMLFGPTDPRLWQPPGQVRVLQGGCAQAPCSLEQARSCSGECLSLSWSTVLSALEGLLQHKGGCGSS